MANHKSAKKRIIRNANRALINGARISRIRTFVKKVEVAIASGEATAAREALRAAQPELQRGVSRGVLHKNTVSRKISRLAARVKRWPLNQRGQDQHHNKKCYKTKNPSFLAAVFCRLCCGQQDE